MAEVAKLGRSSRTEVLQRILRSLKAESLDIQAAALISDDGLVLASALPPHLEEVRVGGMSATLQSLGMRAAHELSLGKPMQVMVRGEHGYAVMSTAAEGTVLLVLTTDGAKLGLVFLDMSRAVEEIAKIL